MKVKLNPMFEQASGQLSTLVFRKVNGVTGMSVAGRKASTASEPTPEQTAVRERFKLAVAYGKSVMADSSVRALYETEAKARNMPVFALTVSDFFHEPTISKTDISAYNGKQGDPIYIAASDDFGVVKVQVSMLNGDGVALEKGLAVETPAASGHWLYTAKTTFPPPTELDLLIEVMDRPGGIATFRQNLVILE